MIVVDTNVIVSLWVPNNMEEVAYKVLEKDSDWVAPHLWKSEFRNVVALYLRKSILDLPTILKAMQEAEKLMRSTTYEVNSTQILHLVQDSKCSSYDCEFVSLADDLGIQLITFDKQLCKEFPDIAISPKEFIS